MTILLIHRDIIEIATASPYAVYLNEKGEWDHSTYPTTQMYKMRFGEMV